MPLYAMNVICIMHTTNTINLHMYIYIVVYKAKSHFQFAVSECMISEIPHLIFRGRYQLL